MSNAAPARLPREKASPVFLDYTRAELDAAYDQTAYMPHIQQLRDRCHSNSARTRTRVGPPLRRRYGANPVEELDIFRTDAPAPAPVFVFIHGGAWRSGSAKQYSAPAEMFVRAGAHYVVPDFTTVQDAGAACSRWPGRSAARSPGSIAMRPISAATRNGSMSAGIRRGRISPRWP